MSKYAITPWRSHTDLLQVRQQLYHPSSDDTIPDPQRHAVDRIMAWKLRGNLPHAVESTALLIDAKLHHNSEHFNSIFSIRAVYSAAFCRFVTGFCDIGRHRERSLEPSSMLEIAKQINMPAEFVALRHEATHEELPGIQRLVRATDSALKWLWEVYWSRFAEPESAESTVADLVRMQDTAVKMIRVLQTERLEVLRGQKKSTNDRSDTRDAQLQPINTFLDGNREKMVVFASVLVDDGFLWQRKRALGSSLDGAYLIWDEPLRSLCRGDQKDLPQALVHALLDALANNSTSKPELDAKQEAISMWALHILDRHNLYLLDSKHAQNLRRNAMQFCCLHPGFWTYRVGEQLLESSDADFEEQWKDVLEACRLDARIDERDAGEDASAMSLRSVGGDAMDGIERGIEDASNARLDPYGSTTVTGSWIRAEVPPRRPLGVA